LFLVVALASFEDESVGQSVRWSAEKAIYWYHRQPWLAGMNYIPHTADNVLEMWQAATFDPSTIDTELGFAKDLGFNIARVFLHYLVWYQDPDGLHERMNLFLTIASSHNIKVMFVLFDDCWLPTAQLGPQPEPIPGVHNSQWVQCPGQSQVTNTTIYPLLEVYVKDVISWFNKDDRVIMWDLYNEPGNSGHGTTTLPLLEKVFGWARSVTPTQPVTAGLWNYNSDFEPLNHFQTINSDIITFHVYDNPQGTQSVINSMKGLGRPAICSEYMARPIGSTFQAIMPLFYKANMGAINWGLVSGRTQTIYPWGSPEGAPYPTIWFHDILNKTGSPFNVSEVEFIKSMTKSNEDKFLSLY